MLNLAEIKLKNFTECSNITKLQNRNSIKFPAQTSQSIDNPSMWCAAASPENFYSH